MRITPPPVSRRWLPRPRLNARLGVPPDKRLMLVISAAGFGKSSCLAGWCRQLALADVPAAWLTAEGPGGDVHTFFADIAAALQRTGLGIGDDVVEIVGRRGRVVAASLLEGLLTNAIAAQSRPVVLIIDDYHTIASPATDQAITGVLAHAPGNFHLVIAGRGAPALRLGKLRAADEVLELGPADLAFDFEETRSFLRERCEIEVPGRDVAALIEATEGWPASLQTIAIAMRSKHDLNRVLRTTIGQPQMLRRYLREEVMQDLPPRLRDFLLRTSILDSFDAVLAAAVADITDASEMIDEIDRRQLFLVPIDDDGVWFRYHHLFGECLRKELAQAHPEQVTVLHLRAAESLTKARRWGEAVRHALEAQAPERALAIVENCAMELVYRGDYLTLTGLLQRLPEQRWRASIKLELAYAWALAYGAVRVETEDVLAGILAQLSTLPPEDARGVTIETKLVRLTIAAFMDRSDHIVRLLEENPELFDCRDTWASDVVNVGASLAYAYAGEHERSRECRPCNHPFKRVYQLVVFGMDWWRQGRPQLAEREWNRALELALSEFGVRSIAAVVAQCFLAPLQYERGQFEALELALGNRLDFIEETTPTDALVPAFCALAWSRVSRGYISEGEALLNRVRIVGKTRGWLRAEALATLELLRLNADHDVGDSAHLMQRAVEVLASQPPPAGPSTLREAMDCFALAVAFGSAFSAFDAAHLERLEEVVAGFNRRGVAPLAVKANLLLARGCMQHGAVERAGRAMAAAQALAQSAGMTQTMRDTGPWARALSPRAAASSIDEQKSSAAPTIAVPELQREIRGGAARSAPALIENISVREAEVLVLVDRGLSNKEIGRMLRIEPETVKWHMKNIFSKLGVANRVQAINRARAQSLLA